jgi:TIR domain
MAADAEVDNPMTPHGPYAFISHAKSDRLLVENFMENLREAGLEVWQESAVDYSRDDSHRLLRAAIHESAIFVALLTSVSISRPWVRWEIDEARKWGKIPVITVDCGLASSDLTLCRERGSHSIMVPLGKAIDAIFDHLFPGRTLAGR